ncbi:helix-turn-helix transcriptional regulator [Flavobacterium sp. ZT3R18]|uniref:ArsR/SmtB family transcription factor n=1 Tax=Flavobacterium sp. ZT3R18 TaxID=2594429 RepID=UPI001179E313|nr:winged helix-turn-helix domain-containing protein [Flavobacterium sp. ZT3R18]TRX37292.1 helix-turn-helix transcriptional regulator [Flavobacterium sp. ZT3R18]
MENQFKQIATLIGDPTRATIMWTLLEGKAFTATELAITVSTSPQNISMHLTKLVQANLLVVESQGRHKYYRFARKEIAYAIEAMISLVPPSISTKKNKTEKVSDIKHCRTCYDHLAGKVGVALTDSLLQQQLLIDTSGGLEISPEGEKWFTEFGIPLTVLKQQKRSFLRPCLDWSERRPHIAGSLATALLDKMLHEDWLRKTKDSRALIVTAKGKKEFKSRLGIAV